MSNHDENNRELLLLGKNLRFALDKIINGNIMYFSTRAHRVPMIST